MADLRPPTGLYFEDYQVGDSIVSQGRTIAEADIVNFASLSGDWNPLHVDAEAAKQTSFGERIAHGMLVLSMATGLSERLGFMRDTVIAFMELNWQFRAAVKIGDTVRVQATVSEVKPMPRLGGGYVTFKVQVLNQNNAVVQRGTWTVLVKNRPQ
ncbi:MAG: MaoC/PaaZ C-terminal domain-containing protein [Caldilineales bacterium]|nr:MaoC/PaaZ C-terminal domain-containing protein [Caldilineales bacterium]MDW8317357.1 MaoC/PaaZ C-terminal domain-containing protein [Anaerolineae bacterium]